MLIDTLLLVNLELLLCNNIIHKNVFKNPFCWTGLHQTNPYLSMSQVRMRQPIYFRSSEVFPRAFPIFSLFLCHKGRMPCALLLLQSAEERWSASCSHWRHVLFIRAGAAATQVLFSTLKKKQTWTKDLGELSNKDFQQNKPLHYTSFSFDIKNLTKIFPQFQLLQLPQTAGNQASCMKRTKSLC